MANYDLRMARPCNFGSGDKRRPFAVKVERPRGSGSFAELPVNADIYRMVKGYTAARERQAKAMAARAAFVPPPAEPPLDGPVEPQERLTPRQEAFCVHYAARPVATRAAMLAGYSSQSAASRGWKLLRHPLVLARLAEIRAERRLRYEIDVDTLHDKLETLYFEALESGRHNAAIAALRMQASLAGLPLKPRPALPALDEDLIDGNDAAPRAERAVEG